MGFFTRLLHDFIITISLLSIANSIVKFAILEYAVYSNVEIWVVNVAFVAALLLRCYANKSTFLSYDRIRMRGKRTELWGANLAMLLAFMAVFAVNLDLIGRTDFGDGATLEQRLAVMAYSFSVPFIFRQMCLLSLTRRRKTAFS